MAYETSNPPYLITQGVGGHGKVWQYDDDDVAATVRVSGYFTNGYALGMRAGDRLVLVTSTGVSHHFVVNAASSTTVDVTDGVAISAATDSD